MTRRLREPAPRMQLMDELGIDVQIEYFDAGTLKNKIATRGAPYDVALTGWIADFPDASSFFSTQSAPRLCTLPRTKSLAS